MQKSSPMALMPVCCLAIAATTMHLFNKTRTLPEVTSPQAPVVVAQVVTSPQAEQELQQALHQIVQAYKENGFDALETRTTPERWDHWHRTSTGEQVQRRMQLLATWPDIALRGAQARPSGCTEVLATCGGEQLKVWMAHKEGGWKLLGIVAAPRPE